MAKRALLVGINDYKTINDLSGCVNDVTNIRDILLKYFGFAVPDIRVITDSRASKDEIVTRLKWLIASADKGDTLVFHYSGHGSKVRDRNDGDELEDHMDEALCPYDVNWDSDSLILDDDLYDIFKGLKDGVNLEVLLDCCYSGTGTRGIMPKNMKNRYFQPPIDIRCRFEDNLKLRGFGTKSAIRTIKLLNHTLWAASKDNQPSADAEIEGAYNGAFTYYFCKYVRECQGKITRKELLQRIRASLEHNGYEQIPQLEVVNASKENGNVFA
jgi:metacaspase-1